MTTRKKGSFSAKGKTILDESQPTGLGDILDDTPTETSPIPSSSKENQDQRNTENRTTGKPATRKTVQPEIRNTDNTVVRKDGNTKNRKTRTTDKRISVKPSKRETGNTDERKTVKTENIEEKLPTKREEFRLPADLAERLRVYAFDFRSKKTVVVIDALDDFLKKEGY